MRSKPLAVIPLALLLLGQAACSANRTSLDQGDGTEALFVLPEQRAFELAYSAVQEVFPTYEISVVTAPARGYVTRFLAPPLYLDWFVQRVYLHRAEGITTSGELVSGYWIQVEGGGSSFLQGQLRNKEVFERIESRFEEEGRPVAITSRRPTDYQLPQERFYVRGADTLEGDRLPVLVESASAEPSEASVAEKIRALGELRDDGLLTEEEFDAAKARLLEQI